MEGPAAPWRRVAGQAVLVLGRAQAVAGEAAGCAWLGLAMWTSAVRLLLLTLAMTHERPLPRLRLMKLRALFASRAAAPPRKRLILPASLDEPLIIMPSRSSRTELQRSDTFCCLRADNQPSAISTQPLEPSLSKFSYSTTPKAAF